MLKYAALCCTAVYHPVSQDINSSRITKCASLNCVEQHCTALYCCAVYRPVSQDIDVSKIANVQDYYPNLAQVARLDENEALPFMHEVHRAKIVWTVVFKGVVGEVGVATVQLQESAEWHCKIRWCGFSPLPQTSAVLNVLLVLRNLT